MMSYRSEAAAIEGSRWRHRQRTYVDADLSLVVEEVLFGLMLTERAIIALTCRDGLMIRETAADLRVGRDEV